MSDIKPLRSLASGYLSDVDLSPLNTAWEFIQERHGSQFYATGEPYVDHLLAVGSTLASMRLDLDTIVAGLLHGTIKEHVADLDELKKKFGQDVANLVDGATRITNVRYNSHLAHEAENIRKLLLAMGADIRVLLVKLADRLQDMLSLEAVDEQERRIKARETMDLYAPLASRIGIEWLKRELEDLAFRYLLPVEYADLAAHMESTMAERQVYVDDVIHILHQKLNAAKIVPVRIIGRPKHLYSIYKKLVAQRIPLERVYDKVAFRIIVRTVKECYQALGTVHADWTPVPGRIKDWISAPKSNNYQSLHTTVSGPDGQFIEIQIRTEDMDRVAQEGVAAHWAYKEGQKITSGDAKLFKELKRLVQSLQEVEDPSEFMESVRGELFEPDVFALTPSGEVRELPHGSTPIDFAYSIHSEVGDTCVGAKISGQIVQLKHKLQSGDIVEILTQKNQHPRRAWLQLVKTSRARTRIRQYLRREEKERSLKLGREICERELKKYDVNLKGLLKSGHLRLLLKKLNCNSLDEMLVRVGSGSITVPHLLRTLQPEEFREAEEKRRIAEMVERAKRATEAAKNEPSRRTTIDIDGVDGMLIKISQCCRPVPGDAIIGFITTGSGVSVHKADCLNLKATDPARWLDVSWSGTPNSTYRAGVVVRSENRKNLLADISGTISADDANIVELNARTTVENIAEINVLIEVMNLEHLQRLQQHLLQMPEVIEVRRK
ncbi:bifunctional (p)ppGpp synthetase/guanosine-3',5'-bis(diphosphate) 3'-pyrophosphohydrolase [Desulfobulbus rhabdoformis]|uniref:RelA/SpoT family protein n=1 Tax=Desulfobulbus rhabdoformis TaxID=34032 RepID=UPI00196502FA|nr:bifunctional (p)ppGpp synthetase/guanosine-3',5'-bis(diphosphate) 3'-pyrophosphohydrolase [Desulfobulbus rhabdoformis]MBM9614598.1 bifunctional (p)ppGpp synthetase/guanosine-3',5'-bis(diphosphate) 3'-pyrophosphohydrolase [Desulfobulbus rhabdoformis]